jgi:hypothetical protein
MTLASEVKFLVDPATAARIRDWARARLEPDPFGEGPFADQYRTTSLYFDTPEFDVFNRRGSYGRSKYRIRRYDGQPVAFLERKLRRGTRLCKRRSKVPLDQLARLDEPIVGPWAGTWFERRLIVRRLHPICQISYSRLARVGMRDSGPIRLTIDEDIRVQPATTAAFDGYGGVPALPQKMVLELKYRDTLPAIFRQLVEEFALTPRRASKYRFAMGALGLVLEDNVATPAAAHLRADAGDATYA